MKINVADAEGAVLDWMVAEAVDEEVVVDRFIASPVFSVIAVSGPVGGVYRPSAAWFQGGPLLEKYDITLTPWDDVDPDDKWGAALAPNISGRGKTASVSCGRTLLIAAMRAIVMAELGETVDVPDELIGD